MNTKTTGDRMFSLVILYDMQTTFFLNAIDGISDADTHNRLNTKANHIAWLTGSAVEQRFELAGRLGIDNHQGAHELFKDNKGIQNNMKYPSLLSYKEDWQAITPQLRQAMMTVSDEMLDTSFEMEPGFKMTTFDLISFCSYREANVIGQIALWRRLLGYDAMKYM